jgi:transcriptional regulator with GAF, ATPase, and Fis domain
LVVSPNSRLKAELQEKLRFSRWSLSEAASGAEAIERLSTKHCEIILLDPVLPDLQVEDFSAIVREQFPTVQLISVDPQTGMPGLGTPSPTGHVAVQLTEAIHRRGEERSASPSLTTVVAMRSSSPGVRGMIGDSTAMQQVYKMVRMVAKRDTTVLVKGESGTGKEMVALALHEMSERRKEPLVVINCAAIPEPLLEAELFGYTKGSFTGASQSRIGRIQAAHGGTLFLDEIGEMPLALQSKILRFLEQGEVQRLGGNDNLKVDVRVVAATNAKLQDLVKQKLFREDLYYRLNVFPIELPPLRERHGDVRRLAEWFLGKYTTDAVLSYDALALLEAHDWPGNVRELRNVIERSSILADEGQEILAEHILL